MFIDAARVIVLGEVWRRFVAEQVPAAADRIVILPNATRATRLLHEPASDVRILFLGRIGPRKGVPQLIEALSGLPHEVAWSAVIAGDGDLSESQAQITALGLSERVTLPGWVGPADVEVLFARSDILVLPSFDENLPMSVIEAMAAGLAVVTTPVGATEDIIAHGETGLLVPPGEVPPLREAIARLVADPELRFRLGEAARKVHAERLEITPYVDQLRRIWQEAAS
jgi:glycosyltransferase involved in cell wall biosynthesis